MIDRFWGFRGIVYTLPPPNFFFLLLVLFFFFLPLACIKKAEFIQAGIDKNLYKLRLRLFEIISDEEPEIDEADEGGDREGAPGFFVQIIIGDGGVAGIGVGYSFWQVIGRDEERAECAAGFTERAVLLPISEADDAAGEGIAEGNEIPAVSDGPLPSPAEFAVELVVGAVKDVRIGER